IDPEDPEIASVTCHFQKGAIPTHTEHQIIASNARELATVEAIVGQPHDFESRLYGCQGALVFLMAVPHGLHDRLAVALQWQRWSAGSSRHQRRGGAAVAADGG